jgi:hypothetical protein
MVYKFGELIVTDPTFTISEGNTVGDFVTVNARVNFNGAYFDWMLGAMQKHEDMDTWAATQIEQYRIE